MNKEKNQEGLCGKDYMYKPLLELVDHPDYSAHAMRVVTAISKMNTQQLEELTIVKGSSNG